MQYVLALRARNTILTRRVQPEQADPGNLARGNQAGYNRCNSTTEGSESMCQTGFVNNLSGTKPLPFNVVGVADTS